MSSAPINLRAITELNSSYPVNINLLTHLEYERVKFLIKEEGMDLREAKIQAQQEILAVFSLNEITTGNSESLNIISSGEGDGGWGEYTYTDTGSAIGFILSGKDEGDYISEIQVRCSGTGTLRLTSSDLEISEGEYLDRSYALH